VFSRYQRALLSISDVPGSIGENLEQSKMRWLSLVGILPVAFLLAPCDGDSLLYECGDLLSHFDVTDEGTPKMAGGCRGLATTDGSRRHFCAFCRENSCDQVVIDMYSAFDPNSNLGSPWAYNFTLPFRPHETTPTLIVKNSQEALDNLVCTNSSFQCDEHQRHNCIASNHLCDMPTGAPARVMLSEVCNSKKCTDDSVIEEAVAIASNGILVLRPFGTHVGTTVRGTEIRLDRSNPSIDGNLSRKEHGDDDDTCTGKFTEQGVYHYSALPILRHVLKDDSAPRRGDTLLHVPVRHHDSTSTVTVVEHKTSEWCGTLATPESGNGVQASAVSEYAPVGVAFDGHVIYSPPTGTTVSGLDLCNGKYDEVNREYKYFVTSHFPYWPGCFGPSSGDMSYSPSCTANPPPNRKYPTAFCSTDSNCSFKSRRRTQASTQVRRRLGLSEEELRDKGKNGITTVYILCGSLVIMTFPLIYMFLMTIHYI